LASRPRSWVDMPFSITFEPAGKTVTVPPGTSLMGAAELAELEINQPCGGQGRCGRCVVKVESGQIRRRSTLRLSSQDIADGYVLACQAVIEGDAIITIPPQEKARRHLVTDKTAVGVELPFPYAPEIDQTLKAVYVEMDPPSMADQTDDWSRLKRALVPRLDEIGCSTPTLSIPMLQRLGGILREADWRVTVVVETGSWDQSECPPRLINMRPGFSEDRLWGIAVDIGTTTVTVYLVDLVTGHVRAQVADYNGQIARGEDVISRIIYASKARGEDLDGNRREMQQLVIETVNNLIEAVAQRGHVDRMDIDKATVVGNSTMIHLLLGIDASSIRLDPFVTAVNQPPVMTAGELGLAMNPAGMVDCLPGVASYVGSDITAGVLSSRLSEASELTLFMDVGTNGEIVLGTADWLIACAASAGPAFEGAGVLFGMRATRGAIEEVWINNKTYEPDYRVIGNVRPQGLCGSALINLLAELFVTGVMDKAGNLDLGLGSPRVREGEYGPEYVVAWADESADGVGDIVFTKVDIDNLLRAKAAIYGGFDVLARAVGVDLADVEEILIGGNFGKYINVEKAVQIGLLPDVPWQRFRFLGNTAVRGAYMALLSRSMRERVADIAGMMTYLELSADNTFYDAFSAALFLPHTDWERFPSVQELFKDE
jgi:uncharacterized 2Fe-2S/4Fe-4S cluster protein (DUF4445 family)